MTNNHLKIKHEMINCVNFIRANSFKILKEIDNDKQIDAAYIENIEQALSRLISLNKENFDKETLMFPFVFSSIDSNE